MDTSQIQSRGSEPLAPPRRFLHCSSCAFWSWCYYCSSSGTKASIRKKKHGHGRQSLRFVTMWLLFGTETSNSHFLTITFWCIFWCTVFESHKRVSFSNMNFHRFWCDNIFKHCVLVQFMIFVACWGRFSCVLRASSSFFYKFFIGQPAGQRAWRGTSWDIMQKLSSLHICTSLYLGNQFGHFFLGCNNSSG